MLSSRPSGGRNAVVGMTSSTDCIWIQKNPTTAGMWRVCQLTIVLRKQMDKSPSATVWVPETDWWMHFPQTNLGFITNIAGNNINRGPDPIWHQSRATQSTTCKVAAGQKVVDLWSTYHSHYVGLKTKSWIERQICYSKDVSNVKKLHTLFGFTFSSNKILLQPVHFLLMENTLKHLRKPNLTLHHSAKAVTIIGTTMVPLTENCQQLGQIGAAEPECVWWTYNTVAITQIC